MADSTRSIERPGHILIYGGFGYGNTGNDATLKVTLQAIEKWRPGTRCTAIAANPEAVEKEHGIKATPIRPLPGPETLPPLGPATKIFREMSRWRQAKKLLSDADCLLIPGTGLFDDFNTTTFRYAYPMWQWCRAARSLGVPVKLLSIGAGPVTLAWTRRLFRQISIMSDHRSYRDLASKQFVEDELRVDTSRDVITPDLAFALDLDAPPLETAEISSVAIGVMDYHSWSGRRGEKDDIYEGYMGKLSGFCERLLREGKQLRIITADRGDRDATNDLRNRLAQSVPDRAGSVAVAEISSLEDICNEVRKVDAVVATRFHTIVSAMMCGRPAVSVGYTSKNLAVMSTFGLGDYCQNIQDFDADVLYDHFCAVTRDAPAVSRRLLAARNGLRSEVEAHFTRVLGEIATRSTV